MPSNPLQLEDYWIHKLEFESDRGMGNELGESGEVVQPEVTWTVFQDAVEGPKYCNVSMQVQFHCTRTPTWGTIHIEGAFVIDQAASKEEVDGFVAINAPLVVYGIARGVVGSVSAIVAGSKTILATMSYEELRKSGSKQMRGSRAADQDKKTARKKTGAKKTTKRAVAARSKR